ncbi:MAG: hypothetical protein ACKOYQ_02255 [Actinomycetota bacterium]
MTRRMTLAVAAGISALGLVLAGCGSAGGGDKDALVDGLMSELTTNGDVTPEQGDCVRGKLNELSVDELTALNNDSTGDAAITPELEEKITGMLMECFSAG